MKHVISILGILFLVALWFLPTFMLWHGFKSEFGMLYITDILLTILWGTVLSGWYKHDKN